MEAAQERGARDFACEATTAKVTRKETIIEGQTTGWGGEAPHRAVYGVTVKGCGKQTAYLVECDTGKKGCATAGSQPNQTGSQGQQLADELQPAAVQAAQQRGSKELECPAATARVNRKETIEEAQTTGWYELPYRALYTITIAGCGKQTSYLVACNKKENRCAAGSPRSGPSTGRRGPVTPSSWGLMDDCFREISAAVLSGGLWPDCASRFQTPRCLRAAMIDQVKLWPAY